MNNLTTEIFYSKIAENVTLQSAFTVIFKWIL